MNSGEDEYAPVLSGRRHPSGPLPVHRMNETFIKRTTKGTEYIHTLFCIRPGDPRYFWLAQRKRQTDTRPRLPRLLPMLPMLLSAERMLKGWDSLRDRLQHKPEVAFKPEGCCAAVALHCTVMAARINSYRTTQDPAAVPHLPSPTAPRLATPQTEHLLKTPTPRLVAKPLVCESTCYPM